MAVTATSSACVESSPPETPMTTLRMRRRAQPLAQPMRLNVEGLEAKLGEPRLVVRHEGKARDVAHQAEVDVARRIELEGDAAEIRSRRLDVGAVAERALAHALSHEPT